jgi:hypothetical protein
MNAVCLANSQANNMYNIDEDCLTIGSTIGVMTVESKRENSQ